jgi:hypothetical protein
VEQVDALDSKSSVPCGRESSILSSGTRENPGVSSVTLTPFFLGWSGEWPRSSKTRCAITVVVESPGEEAHSGGEAIPGLDDMRIETIYIFGKDRTDIVCDDCGKSRTVDVSKLANIRAPRKVNCPCGSTFKILFDRRQYYRKDVSLMGVYSHGNSFEPDAMLITDVSQTGIRFQGLSKELRDLTEIKDLNIGDILNMEFRLNNSYKTPIRSRIVVRHNFKGTVGADFYKVEEHIRKELGFYLMP